MAQKKTYSKKRMSYENTLLLSRSRDLYPSTTRFIQNFPNLGIKYSHPTVHNSWRPHRPSRIHYQTLRQHMKKKKIESSYTSGHSSITSLLPFFFPQLSKLGSWPDPTTYKKDWNFASKHKNPPFVFAIRILGISWFCIRWNVIGELVLLLISLHVAKKP